MALEKWTSRGMTYDGKCFSETTMLWDTKLKKIVDTKTKLLITQEERDARKAKIEPVVLYK